MKVGFTGTRLGMTDKQKDMFKTIIKILKPLEFHHGDAVGADADAHDLVELTCKIHIHPPSNPVKRAFKRGTLYPERNYLTRNKNIVNAIDTLIATPNTSQEQIRSGTWSTIRYARQQKKVIIIINPNGALIKEDHRCLKVLTKNKLFKD